MEDFLYFILFAIIWTLVVAFAYVRGYSAGVKYMMKLTEKWFEENIKSKPPTPKQ